MFSRIAFLSVLVLILGCSNEFDRGPFDRGPSTDVNRPVFHIYRSLWAESYYVDEKKLAPIDLRFFICFYSSGSKGYPGNERDQEATRIACGKLGRLTNAGYPANLNILYGKDLEEYEKERKAIFNRFKSDLACGVDYQVHWATLSADSLPDRCIKR